LYPIDELEAAIKKFEDKNFKSEFASEILRRMRIRRDFALTVDGNLFQTKEGAAALRQAMINREDEVILDFTSYACDSYSDLWSDVIEATLAHTGEINEGDYGRIPCVAPED
jgi:hypothetical protein